jgi:arginyl-tRNA synthetase
MTIWFDIAAGLNEAVGATAEGLEDFDESFSPEIRQADPRFGDFQANGVLAFAKRNQKNPRALAETLIQALLDSGRIDTSTIEISVAGPGFINFKVSPGFLFQWLTLYRTAADYRKAAAQRLKGKRIVVDYGSPNSAKQMHVGHLRSTVIGEAIKRMLVYFGAEVIGDNHIGDWGTAFGKLILAIKRKNFDLEAEHEDPLAELENLYKWGNQITEQDENALEEAREELVKLQNGDEDNLAMWEAINRISYLGFHKVYDRLRIDFDYELGESFYRDKVHRVYDELMETGIGEESEGASVVFFPDHKRYKEQPFLYRKSDGASNYASTDLATVLYRLEAFNAGEIIYVTDDRQKEHFEKLFLTVDRWFSAKGYKMPKLHHVFFGTILGEDRKPIKSRSGTPVLLNDLLNEAVELSRKIVDTKNPDLSDEERGEIAETVGVGAVRYADLMQNRSSDYIFSFEKLLSLEGNTAPYLLYAVARIKSIFRKAGVEEEAELDNATLLETETEVALARKLLAFPFAMEQALSDLRPHQLCTYLFELAGAFSSFYNADKVNVDDDRIRDRRLVLCQRTLLILTSGLDLLGIRTLEKM